MKAQSILGVMTLLACFALKSTSATFYVDANGANPTPPYSSWATAATNIQIAIDASSAGDTVLVTNGVYATGGKVISGGQTNRLALNKAISVQSVNGYSVTVIQGARDAVSTNGPGAVRCAYLAAGAKLTGFTIRNGATLATGDLYSFGGPLESGGGVYCAASNSIVSNCVLTNNSAISGGGIAYGTLNNSLVLLNVAGYGGGSYEANLNNCTVEENYATVVSTFNAGGCYAGNVRNCILGGNMVGYPPAANYFIDYYTSVTLPGNATYSESSDYSPVFTYGTGNISASGQFLDWFHISTTSACRGAGSPLYSTGTDLDGEPWANPPSMGCDEPVAANLVGPLSSAFYITTDYGVTNTSLVNRYVSFFGNITGRASYAQWSFGDGTATVNTGVSSLHTYATPGDYTVTQTVYNSDYPSGVSTNSIVHILPFSSPALQSVRLLTNGFQFQFTGVKDSTYIIQYATNLTSPVNWSTLQQTYYFTGGVYTVKDTTAPKATRFYRVLVQ